MLILMKKSEIRLSLLFLLLLLALSFFAYYIPLEDFLSEYRFYTYYNWYKPWRVAIMNFLIWIISLILYLSDIKEIKYLMIESSILFIIAHYLTLLQELGIVSIKFLPIIYFKYYHDYCTIYLDMGQIVAIVTFLTTFFTEYKTRILRR